MRLQANITLDNYGEIFTSLSGAVRGAATSEQEQTPNNLAMVAATFEQSAALINEMTIVPNTVSSVSRIIMIAHYVIMANFHSSLLPSLQTVRSLVDILEGLQQWDEEVLQANASKLAVECFNNHCLKSAHLLGHKVINILFSVIFSCSLQCCAFL